LNQDASRPSTHASAHRKEIHRLKQLLAEKTLEVDFFKGALQKIEAGFKGSIARKVAVGRSTSSFQKSLVAIENALENSQRVSNAWNRK